MSENKPVRHGPPKPVRILLVLLVVGLVAAVVKHVQAEKALNGDLHVSGLVEARTIEVASEVSGRVLERPVEKGQEVKAGQLLCLVASETTAAALAQAQAALKSAQEQEARAAEALALQSGVSTQDVRRAQAAVGSAEARYGDVNDGARPQEIAAARAQANQAAAALASAQAQLQQLKAGLRPEEIKQAEAAAEAAGADVEAAKSRLADLRAGARTQELEAARALVAKAETARLKTSRDYSRAQKLVEQGALADKDLDASKAAADAAEADLKAARENLALAEAGSRTDQIKAAQAQLEAAQARQRSAKEALSLARQGPRQEEIERAAAAVKQAQAARETALANVALLEAGSRRGQKQLAARQVVEAEAGLGQARANTRQVALRQAEWRAATAAVKQAQAAAEQAQANLEKFRITALVDGLVDDTHIRVGEMVRPGSAIVTLVDFRDTWLTVYVPEPRLPKVRTGATATVTVDGLPGQGFTGTVRRIAAQAEFTPKYVQTQEERARTVFAVELALPNEEHLLKPGMPADAVFPAAELNR